MLLLIIIFLSLETFKITCVQLSLTPEDGDIRNSISRIFSQMDHSGKPCENFYNYACGGEKIQKENAYEDVVLDLHGARQEFVQKFKDFFYGCTSYQQEFNHKKRLEQIDELYREIGEFIPKNDNGNVNLTELIARLILHQSFPFFDLIPDVEDYSSTIMFKMSLPEEKIKNWSGLSLHKDRCLQKLSSRVSVASANFTDVHHKYILCTRDFTTYIESVQAVVEELNLHLGKSSDFRDDLSVLQEVFKILPSPMEITKANDNHIYAKKRISELRVTFTFLDWPRFLEMLTGKQVYDNEFVHIYFESYLTRLFDQFSKADQRKLHNAFLAMYIYDLYVKSITTQNSLDGSFCLNLAKVLFPDVWMLLISNIQRTEENSIIENLYNNLKSQFCQSFTNTNWLDNDATSMLVSKCNKLELVTYKSLEHSVLEKNYGKITISTNYLKNVMTLQANYRRKSYSVCGALLSPAILYSYFIHPISGKLLISSTNNMIYIPLTPNNVYIKVPQFLLLANDGFDLATQMAKHFSPSRLTYLSGKAKKTLEKMISSMTTMMDYASPKTFLGTNISFNLDGALSTNSRIIENTAFRLISDSVNVTGSKTKIPFNTAQFSEEEIFYIAAAQRFCKETSLLEFMLQVFEESELPPVLRVENVMSNSKTFPVIFSCPDGSEMNLFPFKIQFPYLEPEEDYLESDTEYEEEDNPLS